MMIREMGRLTEATLRPSNDNDHDPTSDPNATPFNAFMCSLESGDPGLVQFGKSEYLLHGNGSHILFADGHVKVFDIGYFATSSSPATPYDTQAATWDPTTSQWYNYYYPTPGTPGEKARNQSIAISP